MAHARAKQRNQPAEGTPSGAPIVSKLPVAIGGTAVLSVVLLWVRPELDLLVSSAFYRVGEGFLGDYHPLVQAIHRSVPLISRAAIIALFIALFAYTMQHGDAGRRRRCQIGYLIVTMALGPGLLIDVVLKDNWGRARPSKIVEFGGDRAFSAPLRPANQCDDNCSSASGHAAVGYYLVSLGFLGGAAARRRWTLIGFIAGTLLGLARVSQGGHFFSDILFSFYATWFAAWAVWLLFRRFGWLADEREQDPAGHATT